jgi:hypothetical protein
MTAPSKMSATALSQSAKILFLAIPILQPEAMKPAAGTGLLQKYRLRASLQGYSISVIGFLCYNRGTMNSGDSHHNSEITHRRNRIPMDGNFGVMVTVTEIQAEK